MISLPVCRWRDESAPSQYYCRSAKFVLPPNPVRREFCAVCTYADHIPPPPTTRALPCIHLGGWTGKEIVAKSGRDLPRPVYTCAAHGACVTTGAEVKSPRRIAACGGCADYLPRDPFGANSTEMLRWAEEHLAAIPPYPARRYRGRGVVIAGGGVKYFASMYVAIRALRHVGCRLPIQVWYLGRHDEMPADKQALLTPWGVECVDADRVRRKHPARMLNGWELKVYATLHSPYEEVLFLDADCYPCRQPDFLFEQEDYRSCGAIFWPDVAATDTRLKWAAFGVADPKRPGSVESGQFVLNKRLSWQPLNLAWFYNDHSDYYYRYCHGDKHTFEVAWTRCRQPFVMWRAQAKWAEAAYVHDGPDGQPLFVHRCADKFRIKPESFSTPQRHTGQTYLPNLPLERECWNWLGELLRSLRPGMRRGARIEKIVRIGLPGHFNCSILEHRGRLLLASRQGQVGAKIYLTELDESYQPLWTRRLDIVHPRALAGVEDPRLFHFRGRLHCAFSAVERDGADQRVQQMLCRIGDTDFQVKNTWLPDYPARNRWEKNWQFFEHERELYSVYTIQPHVVLRHHRRRAELVARTTNPFPWLDRHLRGGAPPVRVGDEYYHFFHTVKHAKGHWDYALGLYTFAAKAPFAVRRVFPGAVLSADDYDKPDGFDKSVIFPCGALIRDGRWLLSFGYHDHECRLGIIPVDQIERRLKAVEGLGE